MKISKAVITAGSESQRTLPLQTLVDSDGEEKPVLKILVEEVIRAGIGQICIVVFPGDEGVYRNAVQEYARMLVFEPQVGGKGYGHAVACGKSFVGDEPFLHLVGDHLYSRRGAKSCAQRLIETAETEQCSVSAVQPTRERDLALFGAVSGAPVAGKPDLYRIDAVAEKPTPTEAEQHLMVPGLRAGHYLCFFGMHVLTPAVFEILDQQIASQGRPTLSAALKHLAHQQRYLALVYRERRYDVGAKYGLLNAQLALALSGKDREIVLSQLVDLLAQREMEEPRQ